MNTMLQARSVATALACLLGASIYANDGFVIITGSAVNFGQSQHVQMVSEHLRIKLGLQSADVDVEFVFKNHGPAHSVVMGFPEDGRNPGPTMRGFRSEVDGKPVKVWRKQMSLSGDEHTALWLKRVEFTKGQIRKVRVRYNVEHGGNVTGLGLHRYELRTGATWRGNIATCTITVDSTQLPRRFDLQMVLDTGSGLARVPDDRCRPATWTVVRPGLQTAVLKDVEPDFQFDAYMVPGFWRYKINGERVPIVFGDQVYPRWPLKTGDEVLISVWNLGLLFAYEFDEEDLEHWANPLLPDVSGSHEAKVKGRVLTLPSGRQLNLKRPLVHKTFKSFITEEDLVYLSDVVEALGGRYRYDPKTDTVLMDFRP